MLKFKVTVTYSKQDQSTGQTVPGETFGPYTDENTFAFIATTKDWKVLLSSDGVVCRHSTKPAKRPTIKVTATLKDSDVERTVRISASTSGGQVEFGKEKDNATSTSLTLDIPKNGSATFYISGEKESTKTNDVTIVASTIVPPMEVAPSIEKGSTSVTVLWVDVTVKTNGLLSTKNGAIKDLRNEGIGPNLGHKEITKNNGNTIVVGHIIEFHGEVSPHDFTGTVKLQRDADAVSVEDGKRVKRASWGSQTEGELPISDPGDPRSRDNTPPDIYDTDMPAVRAYKQVLDHDSVGELYANFREFATYGTVRCSDVISYNVYVYLSMLVNGFKIKNSSSSFKNGHITLPTVSR